MRSDPVAVRFSTAWIRGLRSASFVLLLAAAFVLGAASPSVESDRLVQEEWKHSVEMTVGTPTPTVVPGQALLLQIRLKNTGGAVLDHVPRRLRDDLRFKITRGSDSFVQAMPERWSMKASIFQPTLTLKPGEELEYSIILHVSPLNAKEFLFKEAGTVTIDGRLVDLNGKTVQTAKPLSIGVAKPSVEEARVFSSLLTLQNKELLAVWPFPEYLSSTGIADLSKSLASDLATLATIAGPPPAYRSLIDFYQANADHFRSIAVDLVVDPNGRQLPEYHVVDGSKLGKAVSTYEKLSEHGDQILAPQCLGMFMMMGLTEQQPLVHRSKKSGEELLEKYSHTDYALGQWGYKLPLDQ